jgi:hypothetical protein
MRAEADVAAGATDFPPFVVGVAVIRAAAMA